MPGPLWRSIAADLREQIESGRLGPGTQLPSERELGEQFTASRNTVRAAMNWLVSRGLFERRSGQGTFMRPKIEPFVTTLSGDWQAEEEDFSAALNEARDRT